MAYTATAQMIIIAHYDKVPNKKKTKYQNNGYCLK